MSAASDNLRANQKQLDFDGVMVGVSRQAVDETLEQYETMLTALRELEEFLDDQADADDGIPNDAMRLLTEVRAAIAKANRR